MEEENTTLIEDSWDISSAKSTPGCGFGLGGSMDSVAGGEKETSGRPFSKENVNYLSNFYCCTAKISMIAWYGLALPYWQNAFDAVEICK